MMVAFEVGAAIPERGTATCGVKGRHSRHVSAHLAAPAPGAASCLHLIMAAIAAWNAVYLSQAVEELKKRGEVVPEEYLPPYHTARMGTYQSHRPIQF